MKQRECGSETDRAVSENRERRGAEYEEPALRLEKLSAGYGQKPILRDIFLSVKKGEILTLIGPNGAGKSTLLRSVTGELRRMGGNVYLLERNVEELSRRQAARQLSMVMTRQARTEYMTCREVASTGRYPYTGSLGILSGEDWRKVDEALLTVHAEEVADRDFMEISDGQRQRVMLARALCQEPEILVLDEPTSYLDIRYKAELLSTIRELASKTGLAVILSLHELDLAAKISDTVACVRGDGIERVGTPEEIFCGDYISELYELERGSFEPRLGLTQLARVEGEPRIFVIGGAGSAVDTYYRLQRQQIPFAAGILPANDMEYPIAQALASELFASDAYEPPDEALMQRAMRAITSCESVICTVTEFGRYNGFNKKLLEYAASVGTFQAGKRK